MVPGGEVLELDLKEECLTIKNEEELFSERTNETYIKE